MLQIDVESIQIWKGHLSAWMRASYASKKPTGEGSMYRLDIYDCESGRTALLELKEYDGVYGAGKVVTRQHHSRLQAEWSYVQPETSAFEALKFVCEHRPTRKQRPIQ